MSCVAGVRKRGEAYVYRDFNHMNPAFNSTLGPNLLRALRRR